MSNQLELFQKKYKKWNNEIKSSKERDFDFDTLSGEVRILVTFLQIHLMITLKNLVFQDNFHLLEAFTQIYIGANCGLCVNLQGLERRKRQIKGLSSY